MGTRTFFLLILNFGFAVPAIAMPRTGDYCPNSIAPAVGDMDIMFCDRSVAELKSALPAQIIAANAKFGEITAMRTVSTRAPGSDCSDLLNSVIGTNSAGTLSMNEAESSLIKIQKYLSQLKQHFELQVRKMKNPVEARRIITPGVISANTVDGLLRSIQQEQEKGLKLTNQYLSLINHSLQGVAQGKQKLLALSQSAVGGKISCTSLDGAMTGMRSISDNSAGTIVRGLANVGIDRGGLDDLGIANDVPRGLSLEERSVNTSNSSLVSQNWRSFVGRSVGSGECVALVQRAIPGIGSAGQNWLAGDALSPNVGLTPGTPIATFGASGRYENRVDGTSHAAIYLGQDAEGITVLDQYAGSPARIHKIPWNGSGKPIWNASNYRVVRTNSVLASSN